MFPDDPKEALAYFRGVEAAIQAKVGAVLTPLLSDNDRIGTWEMRFWGAERLKVSLPTFVVKFNRDGTANVRDEIWKWKLYPGGHQCWWDTNGHPSLSFVIPIAPVPHIPGLEKGTSQEETSHVWKTSDARVVLPNADGSAIKLLSRTSL